MLTKIVILAFALFCIAGLYNLVTRVPSISNVITLATTHQPEKFTELYFEDHINLPKIITRWKQYSFVFTVHNLENQNMDYAYEVYLQRDEQKIIIDSGEFSLKDNEFKSVKVDLGPLKNLQSKIVVELMNKNQSIDFWMEPK